MNFKIYYSDGSTYSGDPLKAPGIGVVIIVQKDDVAGRSFCMAKDYYVWDGGFWRGCDLFGLWDYIFVMNGPKAISGRSVPNEKYQEIYQIAKSDPDFPRKSAWLEWETKI